MMMRKRIVGTIPLAVICILFLIFIIIWYKQFSFFNFAGASLCMDDEMAAEYAESAKEGSFNLSDSYSHRIARVIFWTKEYADIKIENFAEYPVQITMAGYYGEQTDTLPDALIIEPGDSVSVVADATPGYVVTAYDADGKVSASDIAISHDNVAYMARWKKAVFCMLTSVFACSALCLAVLLLIKNCEKGRKTVAYLSLGTGILAFVLAVVCSMMSWEPWIECSISVFAAFCSLVSLAYSVGKNPSKVKSPVYGGIVAAVVSIAVFFLLITSGLGLLPWKMVGETSSSRIIIYALSFMVFIVLYLILGRISMKFLIFKWEDCLFESRLSMAAGFLFVLTLFHSHFGYEGQNVLIVLALAALFAYGGRFIGFVKKISDIAWYACYLVISMFYFGANIVLNMWGEGAGMIHTDIYYNPICMVAEGRPLQDIGLDCLYGHYALFYIVPMKLFGANMKTIAVVTGISAAVSVFFVLLSMHCLLEKTLTRIVGALLVLCSVTMPNLYLQNFPCRMLFPFILLFFILVCQEKDLSDTAKGRKVIGWYLCGYIICMLAILWNTETGLVCSLAWAVYCVLVRSNGRKLISYFISFALECILILLELFAAVFIWRIYNFSLILKTSDFVYAIRYGLLSAQKGDDFYGGYMSGSDNGVLRWQNEPWLYIMILIILLTCVLLAHSGVFDLKKDNRTVAAYLSLVVIMLGHFVYWLTRPEEYNIILPALTLTMLILYEKYNNLPKDNRKNTLLILYLLVCLSLAKFACRIPLTFERNASLITSGIGSAERYDEELVAFSRAVPESCCTSGRGLRELYLDLNWDYRRAEDIDISEEEYIISEDSKAEFEGFEVIREVPVDQHLYYLYENKFR